MAHTNEPNTSSERSPLLDSQKPRLLQRPSVKRASSLISDLHIPQTHSPKAILYILTFLILVVMTGQQLLAVPQIRIAEDIICRHYYNDLKPGAGHIDLEEPIDEKLCKINDIQQELTLVLGVFDFLTCIPSILFAFPWGMLGDRWGRKPVFALSFVGVLSAQLFIVTVCWFWTVFPLRMVWLAPLFMLVGGGTSVLTNMLYAIVSDISTDATRSNNMFIIMCGVYGPEIFAPSLASILMKKSPWIPLLLGQSIMILGSFVIVFLPETLHMHQDHGQITENTPTLSRQSSESPTFDPKENTTFSRLIAWTKTKAMSLHRSTQIFHSVPIVLLTITFMIHPLLPNLAAFVPRYMSKRFDIPLSTTGYIQSGRAVVSIFLLLVILPGISNLLVAKNQVSGPRWYNKFKLGLTTKHKDIILARASLLFLILGSFLIGLSPSTKTAVVSLGIWTLGTGFTSVCRSLITTLVEQHQVGRLYAGISVAETFGSLGGSPLVAVLFQWGMKRMGQDGRLAWLGAPFFGIAGCCALFGLGIFAVRVPKDSLRGDTADGDADEDEPLGV